MQGGSVANPSLDCRVGLRPPRNDDEPHDGPVFVMAGLRHGPAFFVMVGPFFVMAGPFFVMAGLGPAIHDFG
jgi:hypothetical protein